MSVDTHLYISQRYDLEDVMTILKNHLGIEDAKINFSNVTSAPQMFTINFTFNKKSRMMFCHTNSHLPTGPCILLSLGCNDDAVTIMKGIANVIGGLLEENDCNGNVEIINGGTWEEDGIDYFLKYAHLNNQIPKGTIKELNTAIHQWYDDIKNTDRKKMELFPR